MNLRVHILGIGGTAMSAVAGLFRQAGCEVRGSDQARPYPPVGDLLDRLGIPVLHPYDPKNLLWGPDLVVVGNVIRRTNPEALALLESGLPYDSFPEALRRYFLADRIPIVIAGTHGKTTTSSLVAHLLAAQGRDPSFLIGGLPRNFDTNHHLGRGPHVVLEGDEYDTAFFDKTPKFLHYAPQAAVINNIEFDHADIFADLEAVIRAFAAFVEIVPPGHPLLVPESDESVREVLRRTGHPAISFGVDAGTWHCQDLRWDRGRPRFLLVRGTTPAGVFEVPMIGRQNLHNAVGALALLHEIDAAGPDLPRALASFQGVKKRQEIRGVAGGVTVMEDFAHHPTAVRETLRAVRGAWPEGRIVALFEVESNTSRRRVFQQDYVTAFREADEVFFCRPYDKPDNLPEDQKIDMARLCGDLAAAGVPAHLVPDLEDLAREAVARVRPGDVLLAMSGRDFHGIHDRLLSLLRSRDP